MPLMPFYISIAGGIGMRLGGRDGMGESRMGDVGQEVDGCFF